jgi:hypothetical protein
MGYPTPKAPPEGGLTLAPPETGPIEADALAPYITQA